jgi:hypothetical protein
MAFSGMFRRVAFVRTDVSEELTKATRRKIPEDAIPHSHRRENLKSYIYGVRSQLNHLFYLLGSLCNMRDDICFALNENYITFV